MGRKDDRDWELGTQDEVAWIADMTTVGPTISSAIPPIFDAYATVVLPVEAEALEDHECRLMRLLEEAPGGRAWWLGYLDTGTDDVVFTDAPRVRLYAGWPYVLVKAGRLQAQQWRADAAFTTHSRLADLMFPADRTWLLSALWDDDWWSLGGPRSLIDAFTRDPDLEVREVTTDESATPPGHVSR